MSGTDPRGRGGVRRAVFARALLLGATTVTLTVGLVAGLAATPAGPAAAPVPAAGAGSAHAIARAASGLVTGVHTVVVGGASRTYLSVVPPGSVGRLPLLVVLHGRGQSQRTVVDQSGFLTLAEQRQAVLVFPDGQQRSWNAGGGCCGAAGARGTPDVAFISTVVATALRTLPVDATRVYLVGYSNGGKLAYSVVCAHPKLAAAVATYGSVPLARCPSGAPPVPFLLAAGSRDPILPYGGAPHGHPPLPSVPVALGWLRARDGCPAAPQDSSAGPASLQLWSCRAGTAVEAVLFKGVGHAWPAAVAGLMWQFVSGHRAEAPAGL